MTTDCQLPISPLLNNRKQRRRSSRPAVNWLVLIDRSQNPHFSTYRTSAGGQ